MVVITGDHEGLADHRKELCHTKAGKGIISEDEFTPFIVLNSPVPMHYLKVMGQIDIYPTLLNLLGLENSDGAVLVKAFLTLESRALPSVRKEK